MTTPDRPTGPSQGEGLGPVGSTRREPPELSATELRGRINLALSILNHRSPSPDEPLIVQHVRLALLGATIDDLLQVGP